MSGNFGPEGGDREEMTIINREVSWRVYGLELIAVPRHAVSQKLGLAHGVKRT